MRNIFIVLFIIHMGIVHAQKNEYDCFSGCWISYKKELKSGESGTNKTLDGKPYKPNMQLCFVGDSVDVNLGGFKARLKYRLQDQYLLFGTKKYIIEKFDKENLILLEVKTGAFKVEFRRYFKRMLNESATTTGDKKDKIK